MADLSPCATVLAVLHECLEPKSRRAEDLHLPALFSSALCSSGNSGSALFVLKLVIKCVQGVCMELGWPVSA